MTRHVWGALDEPDPEALCSPVQPIHADHSFCSECSKVEEANAQKRQQLEADGFGPVLMSHVGSAAPPIGQFDPPATVFAHLSRSDINKLIRVLRRARDQAYGEDA